MKYQKKAPTPNLTTLMVTHDEPTFYANDGKQYLWSKQGEGVMRNKSLGLSVMISEFQCPCHGTMRYGGKKSRTFFHAGANRSGYWTHVELVEQLKEVIYIFDWGSQKNNKKRTTSCQK
ncbi:unnamed protein product [Absidia cylindrospora]